MNLVVQGPQMTRAQAEELAGLAGSNRLQPISRHAWRIGNAARVPSIASYCEERRIDYAFMPEGRRFSDLKLVAMDMDSTLITIECIDELGDLAGKRAEIAAVTERAMRGELDFPQALKSRVAQLAGLREADLLRVYDERLRLTPGADELLAACKRHGVKVLLVSGGFTFFTERLKARLGLDYTISNVLEVEDGRLTGRVLGSIVDADAKAAKFRSVLEALHGRKEESVAIGDGANDLKMMAEAGLAVAFHAKPVVRAQAGCALTWSGLDGVVNLFE